MRRPILSALLMALLSFQDAAAAEPLAFERGSWAKLRASHAGQPTVIHFWGLTCGPCLVELPRTALIDADGKTTILPGIADLAQVRAWLDTQPKSSN